MSSRQADHSEQRARDKRLAAALRENIRRRKAQARARAKSQQTEPATHDSAGIVLEKA
jgi:hypothetical protein